MTVASTHFGVPMGAMLDITRRLGLEIFTKGHSYNADFGGRCLQQIHQLYIERLPPAHEIDFKIVRRDWLNLRIPKDVVVDRLIEAAVYQLRVVRNKPIQWRTFTQLVPFDRDTTRPIVRALIIQSNGEALGERWRALPPNQREAKRRRKAEWDPDTDPRLDTRVAEALGCKRQHVNALYSLGIIEEDPEHFADDKRRVRSPERLDRDQIREILRSDPPRITAANVSQYRIARLGFCLGPYDHHCLRVVNEVLELYADTTLVPNPTMLANILDGDPQQFVQPLLDYSRRSGKTVRWARQWAPKFLNPSVRDLLDAMQPDIPLFLTAADEIHGSMAHSPNTDLIRKVFGLGDVENRTRSGIVLLEGTRMGLSNTSLERALNGLNNILPLFEGLCTSIPSHVDAILGPYAFLTEAGGIDERRRLKDVAHFKVACSISQNWFNRLKPEEKPDARRFFISFPVSGATFFDRVQVRLGRITADSADTRDDRLADWIADPDRMVTLMMQRADRTFAFYDTVEECIKHADKKLEAGEWNAEGPFHWVHTESFMELTGAEGEICQKILFSVETWKSKGARIKATELYCSDPWKQFSKMMSRAPWRGPRNPLGPKPNPVLNENRYVIVVHDIVPSVPGGRTSPPIWHKIFKGCVLESGNKLPADLADERIEAIRETGIHDLGKRIPGGLFNYHGLLKRTIVRHARIALGEVCIPIHELTHGTALAMFSASARYDLPERSGELAQTDLEEEKWESYVDPNSGEEYGIFQQIRKGRKSADDFIYSPYTMSVLQRVVQLASTRFFGGGDWPLIKPSAELRRREIIGTSTYVITDGRSVINHSAMASLFYILAGGIGVLLPHDMKHMLNAIARREGVTTETRRRWNFHRNTRTTEGYGRPSKAERSDDTLLFLRLMQARRVGMKQSGDTTPQLADNQIFLTKRDGLSRARALAADLVAVLEKHGALDAALAKREEIKNIDKELAIILRGHV